MSGRKRGATRAAAAADAAAEVAGAKRQKLPGRAADCLQDLVDQQRSENRGMTFNKKRLRFLSDAEKVKQGSKGVLYWMSRDQRVQGENVTQPVKE